MKFVACSLHVLLLFDYAFCHQFNLRTQLPAAQNSFLSVAVRINKYNAREVHTTLSRPPATLELFELQPY